MLKYMLTLGIECLYIALEGRSPLPHLRLTVVNAGKCLFTTTSKYHKNIKTNLSDYLISQSTLKTKK